MSGLLYGVGAIAVVVGAVLVGFGIPINEFGFGNTLIISGVTVVVGGLIIVGLGVVVSQLQRLNEAMASRAPIRASRPLDMFESAPASRPAPPVPFLPKTKADAGLREQHVDDHRMGSSIPIEEIPATSFAPTLHNPYEPPVTVDDGVSLSPQHPMSVPAPTAADFDMTLRHESPQEPALDSGWRSALPPSAPGLTRQPQTGYFDAMWPAEDKPAAKPSEPKFEAPPREAAAPPASHPDPKAPKPRHGNKPRTVAILKSGVVDGMGYTLYVDGSIEAELPQGTLRFGSINELRSHLENNA